MATTETTTKATTETTTDPPQPGHRRPRSRRIPAFVVLAAFLVAFAAASLFATRQSLRLVNEQAVGEALTDTVARYRAAVGDASADRTEALVDAVDVAAAGGDGAIQIVLYLDGEVAATAGTDTELPLPTVGPWTDVTASQRGEASVEGAVLDYLAVPIVSDSAVDGVFVAALPPGAILAGMERAVATVAAGLAVLLILGLGTAWWLAGWLATGLPPVDGQVPPRAPTGAAVPPADAPPATGVPHERGWRAPAVTSEPPAAALPSRPALRNGGAATTTASRVHAVAAQSVPLAALTLDIYSTARDTWDREWILDVPPDATVHVDASAIVRSGAYLAGYVAARTSPGTAIVVGGRHDHDTARVYLTTLPRRAVDVAPDADMRGPEAHSHQLQDPQAHDDQAGSEISDLDPERAAALLHEARRSAEAVGAAVDLVDVSDTGLSVALTMPGR